MKRLAEALPTDLELTHYQQLVPGKNKKWWKKFGHGRKSQKCRRFFENRLENCYQLFICKTAQAIFTFLLDSATPKKVVSQYLSHRHVFALCKKMLVDLEGNLKMKVT